MKPFRFQQFSIQQSKNVFRVGTDGVLLGALCSLSSPKNILEVGTGSGLISLMLAQRESSAEILAIDINSEAIELAGINFKNSPFSDRLKTKFQDFKDFESDEKFDLIVCNPPFFEENNSAKDILARQQVELNFENLIEKSSQFLSSESVFSVIIPSFSADEFVNLALRCQLNLVRKINVFGIEGGSLKRNILEFSLASKDVEILDFTIEKSPRNYSEQYLQLTKDFHVFGK